MAESTPSVVVEVSDMNTVVVVTGRKKGLARSSERRGA